MRPRRCRRGGIVWANALTANQYRFNEAPALSPGGDGTFVHFMSAGVRLQ